MAFPKNQQRFIKNESTYPMIKNKHIEIVSSTNKRLSSMSDESRVGVLKVLSRQYLSVGITIVNTFADLQALVATAPDLVFLGMNFVPRDSNAADGDKIWLSKYFDEHRIAYTGSGFPAHQLEHDKSLAKQRVLDVGLQTSPFTVARAADDRPSLQGTLPAFPLHVPP